MAPQARFRIGQRVRLRRFGRIPVQYGVYQGRSGRGMCVVTLEDAYITDREDDGIRELDREQLTPAPRKTRTIIRR